MAGGARPARMLSGKPKRGLAGLSKLRVNKPRPYENRGSKYGDQGKRMYGARSIFVPAVP